MREFPDRPSLMLALAREVAGLLRQCLAQKIRVSMAVPGGTTPAPFFDLLCQYDLAWDRVDILLTDERFVPPDSPRSNTSLIRQRLLQNRAAAAHFVPMYAAAKVPNDVLAQLSDGIKPHLPLDICILGMGVDKHIASLFFGADNLDAALKEDAPVLLSMNAPDIPEPRLTLSARVLQNSGAIFLLITGTEKRLALCEAQQTGPTEQAPVRAILGDKNKLQVFYSE